MSDSDKSDASGVAAAPTASPAAPTPPPATQPPPIDSSESPPDAVIAAEWRTCSGCDDELRHITDFPSRLDNGLRRKSCYRHGKKLDISDFALVDGARGTSCDAHTLPRPKLPECSPAPRYNLSGWNAFGGTSDWNALRGALAEWPLQDDLQVQNSTAHVLPFDSLPALTESVDRAGVSRWFDELATLVWQLGGYKYSRRNLYQGTSNDVFTASYGCCQDAAAIRVVKREKVRDRKPMTRYACHGRLKFKASFAQRILLLSAHHRHHPMYTLTRLTPAMMDFIDKHTTENGASEIHHLLVAANVDGAKDVTVSQVYHYWRKAKRDAEGGTNSSPLPACDGPG
ncbi:hypothetical protein SEPCBS119000_002704 [Sporothrix epigloea]|uniref:Uncharacterized protein n=1 Tax=Sporothrix epigloea TaxID=1892477 RepID=A0ABP0DHL6_9PEZI